MSQYPSTADLRGQVWATAPLHDDQNVGETHKSRRYLVPNQCIFSIRGQKFFAHLFSITLSAPSRAGCSSFNFRLDPLLVSGLALDQSLLPCPGGGGALRYFRYRVCAAGQGIVFTIIAPEPGIVFCKNAPKRVYSFQIFAPRQDYSVFS